MSRASLPAFPFREIDLVGLGGRMHGPMPHPWTWEVTVPHFNFWFLIQGEGRLRCHGRDYALAPGTCFLLAPGTRVMGQSTSQESIINFSIHFFPSPRSRKIMLKGVIDRLSGRKVHRMALFLELARHCADAYKRGERGDALGLRQAELAAMQMMLHLWHEASAPPAREQDDHILQLLAETGRKAGVTVPDLARRVGLSTSQFTRRVRVLTDLSPTAYLIRERIAHACSLLAETSQSVGQVAETLGYNDPSYFVRQFQEVMKLTPARFRQKAREQG